MTNNVNHKSNVALKYIRMLMDFFEHIEFFHILQQLNQEVDRMENDEVHLYPRTIVHMKVSSQFLIPT